MPVLADHFAALVDALGPACVKCYGSRLISVAVFGSVARGTMTPDSDIDVLVVALGLPAGRLARVREFGPVEEELAPRIECAETRGIHTRLSPVIRSPEELEHGSPLLLDMTKEVRILVDHDNRLAGRLARLSARLAELGSVRIRRGGGYYWLLKPDFRPGEQIEL